VVTSLPHITPHLLLVPFVGLAFQNLLNSTIDEVLSLVRQRIGIEIPHGGFHLPDFLGFGFFPASGHPLDIEVKPFFFLELPLADHRLRP